MKSKQNHEQNLKTQKENKHKGVISRLGTRSLGGGASGSARNSHAHPYDKDDRGLTHSLQDEEHLVQHTSGMIVH